VCVVCLNIYMHLFDDAEQVLCFASCLSLAVDLNGLMGITDKY
jgi:hypothetical protein